MKPGQGKSKGGAFERKMCERLSLWLSDNTRNDLLCRTVGSGAQFTFSQNTRGIPGDIRAQDSIEAFDFFSFYVCECKFWKDLELLKFISKKGELYKALEKVRSEAKSVKKKWILVCKQNFNNEIIFLSSEFHLDIFKGIPNLEYHILFSDQVILISLKHFLESISAKLLIHENKVII